MRLFESVADRQRIAAEKAAAEAAKAKAKKPAAKPAPKPPTIGSASDPPWMRPNTEGWDKKQVRAYTQQVNEYKTLQQQLAGAQGSERDRIRGRMDNLKFTAIQTTRNGAVTAAEARQIGLQGQYLETISNIQAQQRDQYADIQKFNQQQLDLLLAAQNQQNTLLSEIQAQQTAAQEREAALAARADVQAQFESARQQLFAQQVAGSNIQRQQFRRQLMGGQVARFSLFNAM